LYVFVFANIRFQVNDENAATPWFNCTNAELANLHTHDPGRAEYVTKREREENSFFTLLNIYEELLGRINRLLSFDTTRIS
jgi:hypothetical protein